MANQLKNLKQQNNLQGLMITDDKGFEVYNNGFNYSHHLHSLKQLQHYFFPEKTGTVVGIETNDYTIIVQQSQDGQKLVVTREKK